MMRPVRRIILLCSSRHWARLALCLALPLAAGRTIAFFSESVPAKVVSALLLVAGFACYAFWQRLLSKGKAKKEVPVVKSRMVHTTGHAERLEELVKLARGSDRAIALLLAELHTMDVPDMNEALRRALVRERVLANMKKGG